MFSLENTNTRKKQNVLFMQNRNIKEHFTIAEIISNYISNIIISTFTNFCISHDF